MPNSVEFEEIELSRYYSQGAKGGAEFLTSILGSPQGAQQRNIARSQAIHKFEIMFHGENETTEFPKLLDFFMSRYGAAIGFRFFPFFDNSWKDEQIALTAASKASYNLIRTYKQGNHSYVRRIVKPILPLTVTINGQDAIAFSNYSVDSQTGRIAFETPSALPAGGTLRVTGNYCIPVCFDTDKVDISGYGGTFDLDGLRVVELLPAALGINDSGAAVYAPDIFKPSTPVVTLAAYSSDTAHAITVSWTASTAQNGKTVVGYKVKLNGSLIPNVVGGLTVDIGSLAPDTDYVVSVASYDSAGLVSTFSANQTIRTKAVAVTPNAQPPAPTNPQTNDSADTFGFTLATNYPSLTDYEYSVSSGAAGTFAPVTTNPIGVGNANYAVGQIVVRVKAAASRNAGYPLSNAVAFTASGGGGDTTAPTVGLMNAPTVVSSSGIDLSWAAANDTVGVTGYEITYSLSSAFTTPTIITVGNVLAYSHTGLSANTTYYYKLRAFDTAANYSPYSNTVSAATGAAAGGGTTDSPNLQVGDDGALVAADDGSLATY